MLTRVIQRRTQRKARTGPAWPPHGRATLARPLGAGGRGPAGPDSPEAKAAERGGAEQGPADAGSRRPPGREPGGVFRDPHRVPGTEARAEEGRREGSSQSAGRRRARRTTRARHSLTSCRGSGGRSALQARLPGPPAALPPPPPPPPRSARSAPRASGLRSGESPPPAAPAARGGGGAWSAQRPGRGRARTPAPRCARPSRGRPSAGAGEPAQRPSQPPGRRPFSPSGRGSDCKSERSRRFFGGRVGGTRRRGKGSWRVRSSHAPWTPGNFPESRASPARPAHLATLPSPWWSSPHCSE